MDGKRDTVFFEDLSLGMEADYSKVISEEDVNTFAILSGDFNPVHVDEEYAKNTMFNGRIVHGFLSAASISTVFGMKLPGPGSIYVSQNLSFKAPVRIGEKVVTKVVVVDLIENKKMVVFTTTCFVEGKIVVDGTATLKVPSRAIL